MIFSDFQKALAQIGDPRFRSVLLRGVALTLLLFGPFVFGVTGLIYWLLPESVSVPFFGEITFLNNLLSGLSFTVLMLLSVFLMIPVAALFIGFFVEEVARAVEARYYPDLPQVRKIPLASMIFDALQFLALMIFVNLLALILYFTSTLLAPVIFWLVNGWLLGREYFQLVAARHLGHKKAKALRKKHFFAIWIAGTLMAVPLSVPLLNLLVPILGVATFTHQFHRLNKDP